MRTWHWQLAAQQEGAGENRGRLLETPAKTRRRKARERAKRLLAAPAKRRGKKKHRGREDRPHPSEERARAGKDSAVAPKHGLSWTPIGMRGERYAAVALKKQSWHCVHLSGCAHAFAVCYLSIWRLYTRQRQALPALHNKFYTPAAMIFTLVCWWTLSAVMLARKKGQASRQGPPAILIV